MVQAAPLSRLRVPQYIGLRLSADEYLALPDDGFKYQVLNGIVVMSPSPTPWHQSLVGDIVTQLNTFFATHPVGRALPDVDVRFAPDLVYRPDLVVIRRARLPKRPKRIDIVPDLIVEIVSPGSEAMDLRTKLADYQRYGVTEYWIVSLVPGLSVRALTLVDGRYVELPETDRVASTVFEGFTLDVAALRAAWDE